MGASVLLNLASVSLADEPAAPQRRSVADGSTPRPAAERWKRLKNQYNYTPAAAAPSAQADRSQQADTGSATLRSVPEKTSPVFSATPVALKTTQEPGAETAIPVRTAPPAVAPAEQEPEWVLPVPVTQDELAPEGLTAEEILSRPEEPESPIKDGKDPDESTKPDVPYEDKSNVKTPVDSFAPSRGRARPTPEQLQNGPTRKTTQVRRIGDIAPLNDFNKDTEIKRYAAEKAREFNVRFGGEQYTPRNFPDVALPWSAPTTKYYPLYFQDPALERYGHTHHPLLQPIVSSARFSAQLVLMPYQLAIEPPWELHSPLGWYRPGDCVPKLHYPFPWSAEAAAVQAAAVTGFIYVIP